MSRLLVLGIHHTSRTPHIALRSTASWLDAQASWQVQYFVNLEVQISWQSQGFVVLEVQISRHWQLQMQGPKVRSEVEVCGYNSRPRHTAYVNICFAPLMRNK